MEIQEMSAEERLAQIKVLVDNFDKCLTFEHVSINGWVQTFVRASDYSFLKTQISALVDTKD